MSKNRPTSLLIHVSLPPELEGTARDNGTTKGHCLKKTPAENKRNSKVTMNSTYCEKHSDIQQSARIQENEFLKSPNLSAASAQSDQDKPSERGLP